MDVEIVDKESIDIIGMEFYDATGMKSNGNTMSNLWERFSNFCKNKWHLIEEYVVDLELSYELHIWNPKELEESGKFHVFIGVEVKDIDVMPLELVRKQIPSGKYAHFILKGEEIDEWESHVYENWFSDSKYAVRLFEGYQFHIQCYDEKRFKGLDNLLDSELDVYVPVIKK